jgi:hypothetical protein
VRHSVTEHRAQGRQTLRPRGAIMFVSAMVASPCRGLAKSAGSVLLAGGNTGRRALSTASPLHVHIRRTVTTEFFNLEDLAINSLIEKQRVPAAPRPTPRVSAPGSLPKVQHLKSQVAQQPAQQLPTAQSGAPRRRMAAARARQEGTSTGTATVTAAVPESDHDTASIDPVRATGSSPRHDTRPRLNDTPALQRSSDATPASDQMTPKPLAPDGFAYARAAASNTPRSDQDHHTQQEQQQQVSRSAPRDKVQDAATQVQAGGKSKSDQGSRDNKAPTSTTRDSSPAAVAMANSSDGARTSGDLNMPPQILSVLEDKSASSAEDLCLLLAVRDGNVELARSLVSLPLINPAARDSAALQLACANGNVELVKLLLNDGRSDPTAMSHAALSLALQCTQPSGVEVVELLLADKRVDPLGVGARPLVGFFSANGAGSSLDAVVDAMLDTYVTSNKAGRITVLTDLLNLVPLEKYTHPRLQALVTDDNMCPKLLSAAYFKTTLTRSENARFVAGALATKKSMGKRLQLSSTLELFAAHKQFDAIWTLLDRGGFKPNKMVSNVILKQAAIVNEAPFVQEWLKRYAPPGLAETGKRGVEVALRRALKCESCEVLKVILEWYETFLPPLQILNQDDLKAAKEMVARASN